MWLLLFFYLGVIFIHISVFWMHTLRQDICNLYLCDCLMFFQTVLENLDMAKMSLSSSTSEKPVTAEKEEDKNGIHCFS